MSSLPKLRSDLVIKEQTISGIKSFICKDPVKQAYYRYEEEEYFVLSTLDGLKTAADVAREYNEAFEDDLTDRDIQEFISSLKSKDLFERTLAEQNVFLYEKLKEQRKSTILQAKGSAMYFRVKVWDPDRFFDWIMPYIRWIWSPVFVMIMNLFMLSGLVLLLINHQDITVGLNHILDFLSHDASSLVFLWATVMGTIMVHELGHGLTCKRFGGECHEIGFLFMFLNPCMYANVNDAWLFEKKSHRLYVTFAGCYIEIMLGCICLYIWYFTQQGAMINIIAFQIVIVAFFSAIFMNFNPLMKFDGYFALSDYLESPNLRNRSQSYVKYTVQRYLFRLDREYDEYLTRREQWILFGYGSLVVLYLVNVFSGLGFMFGAIFIQKFGTRVGILLTLLLLYKILGHYVKKIFGFIKVLMVEHASFFKRKSVRLTGLLLAVLVVAAIVFVPFTQHIEYPATLEPLKSVIIRTRADGFVKSMEAPNQLAYKNREILMRLNNDDLKQKISLLKIDLQHKQIEINQALSNNQTAEFEMLRIQQKKLVSTLKDYERQDRNLVLHAPFEGVLEAGLGSLENTFLSLGQELGRFIDPMRYKATVNIMEREMEGIEAGTRAHLSLDVQPENLFWGEVTDIATLPTEEGAVRLYQVTVTFPNENLALRTGLSGSVSLETGRKTLLQSINNWVQKTIRLDLQF